MVQLGRAGAMHPVSRRSLEQAVFTRETVVIAPVEEYSDEEVDWADPAALTTEPAMLPSDDWSWHGPATSATGPAWGGSFEIVDLQLRTGRYLLPDEAHDGAILFLETSEELPPPEYVYRVLMCMGERGLLQRFAAILWARPKAWSFEHPNVPDEKARYVEAQHAAVLAAHAEYHPSAPLVFGVPFGHTDPQYVIPSGGEVTVDASRKRVAVTY
jgi:muramoyltetrapeptide carboxypeptidase LdcA involved in peptidoglycan recycling